MTNEKYVCTQIRVPRELHEYIVKGAEEMKISRNSFLVILLGKGKEVWEKFNRKQK